MDAPIILQELLPPNNKPGIKVVLIDHSMPEEGTVEERELKVERKVYPGGNHVQVQQMGLEDHDLVLTGQLRDQWASPGFAEAARETLRDIQSRGNAVWLSWGDTWGRLVLLTGLKFSHTRQGMQYFLTLTHLELSEDLATSPQVQDPQEPLRALDEVAAELDTLSAVPRPPGLFATAGAVLIAIQGMITTTREALLVVADAWSIGVIAVDAVASLRQSIYIIRDDAAALRARLTGTDYGAAVVPRTGPTVLAAWRWQLETLSSLLRLDAALGRAGALTSSLNGSTRWVVAREGDTLQRIAARELHDFRRWTEIAAINNLQPGQAVLGLLRVPTP